jgi:pilus assembly protein Flp/PilA
MGVRVQLLLGRLFDERDGQGLTEYALILALIALVAIVALTLLGGKVASGLSTVASSVTGAT